MDSFEMRQTRLLLDHISRLARGLPAGETNRDEVLRDIKEMESHLAIEPLSRAEIYRLRMHVWELHGSPFKALLIHQVAELGHTLGEAA
jgi:hypothetical protein